VLTLSRRQDESIIIQTPDGDEIRILVHDFASNSIKLSIDASRDYVIHREEL